MKISMESRGLRAVVWCGIGHSFYDRGSETEDLGLFSEGEW